MIQKRARLAGHFNNIKGRGAPIARTAEDKNPFIGREEFLMNRIVQRQGAAPPWVEVQAELETSISTFREVLTEKPSVQRRSRLVESKTHFSHTTPLSLPFPYRIAPPEDQEVVDKSEYVEQW